MTAAKKRSGFHRIDYPRGGHGYLLDGDRIPSVTKIIGDAIPKHLEYWSAELVAIHAHDNPDFFPSLPSAGLRDAAKAVFQAQSAGARDRGTALHDAIRRFNLNEDVEIPAELEGAFAAYEAFLTDWAVDPLYIEAPLVSRTHRYAGTLDLVAFLGPRRDTLALLDVKTGASGVWPEVALQLAAYRNAEWIEADGALIPMTRVDFAAVIWIQDDGYQLIPVDTSPAVFQIFLHAIEVARFTAAGRDSYIGPPMTPAVEVVA